MLRIHIPYQDTYWWIALTKILAAQVMRYLYIDVSKRKRKMIPKSVVLHKRLSELCGLVG